MTALVSRARVLIGPLLVPGTARFFSSAAFARLGIAMTGLGLLLAVRELSGSLALGGSALGVFALGEAVASPQWARLVDRYGQARIVPVLVVLHVGAIGVVILAGALRLSVLIVVAALAAGASVPQAGAYSAARWSHRLTDRGQLRTAFSLEATVNDVTFLTGPLVVSGIVTLAASWAGSVIAAICLTVGCLTLVADRASAPPFGVRARIQSGEQGGRSGLLGRRFLSAVGVNFGLGCFFGAVPVLVTDFASKHGVAAFTGLLLAIPSAVSLAAGLAYGATRAGVRPGAVQVAAAAVLLVACCITAAAPSLLTLCCTLVIGGAAIAPLIASSSQIVEIVTPRTRLTQGFAWVGTASAVGLAAGSSLVAATSEAAGYRTGALMTSVLVGTAVISAAAGRSRLSVHGDVRDGVGEE